MLILFLYLELDWWVYVPVVELPSGWSEVVVADSPGNGGNKAHFSSELTLPWFFNLFFVLGDSSAEEEFLVFGDEEGAICDAGHFPDGSQPYIVQLLESLRMKFSFHTQLSELVAPHHEQVSVAVHSGDMVVPAGNVDDILARLETRFDLLVDVGSFVE